MLFVCQALWAKCKCSSSVFHQGYTQLIRDDLCVHALQYCWVLHTSRGEMQPLYIHPSMQDNT